MQNAANAVCMKNTARRLPIHRLIANGAMNQNRTILLENHNAFTRLKLGARTPTIINTAFPNNEDADVPRKSILNQ
jgi:phage portal protein BeeE